VDLVGQVYRASGSIDTSLMNYSYCMPITPIQTCNELSECMQYGQLMRKGPMSLSAQTSVGYVTQVVRASKFD
jgi:hypothetical protein